MKNYWLRIQPGDQLIGPLNARQVLAGLNLQAYSYTSQISSATDPTAEQPANDAVWATLGNPATREMLQQDVAAEREISAAMEPLDIEYTSSFAPEPSPLLPSEPPSTIPTYVYQSSRLSVLPWQTVLRQYWWMRLIAGLLRILAILLVVGCVISIIAAMAALSSNDLRSLLFAGMALVQLLVGAVANLAFAEFIELVIRTSSDVAYLAERQGRPVDPPPPF